MGDRPPQTPEAILGRILYDEEFRRHLVAALREEDGRLLASLVGADNADHFRYTDPVEVLQVGSRIKNEILRGSASTGLGIRGHFPLALELLASSGGDRVIAAQFAASTEFRLFCDVPYGPRKRGVSLPEAFYLFLAARDTPPDLLKIAHREAIEAIVQIFAANGSSSFKFSIPGVDHIGPLLVAALPTQPGFVDFWCAGTSRFVRGRISDGTYYQFRYDLRRSNLVDLSDCPVSTRRTLQHWGVIDA